MRHLTGECCKMSTTNFSKECFYDALISLCKTENFNDINIKQICKKAGYNRSTFYRHFNCKEDIIRDKARDLIANWMTYFDSNFAIYSLLSCKPLLIHLTTTARIPLFTKTKSYSFKFFKRMFL